MRVFSASLAITPIVSLLAVVCSQPVTAQSRPQISQSCSAAIRVAEGTLKENRDIETQIWYRQLADNENYPSGRPDVVNFGVGGSAASSVMASPQFLTSVTTGIIADCSTISTVVYIQDRSDYAKTFGLMHSGNIEEFECRFTDGAHTASLPWGVVGCL